MSIEIIVQLVEKMASNDPLTVEELRELATVNIDDLPDRRLLEAAKNLQQGLKRAVEIIESQNAALAAPKNGGVSDDGAEQ